MTCPECRWPMTLAREERGIRVWRCEKCKREKRGVTKGELTMSWKVPVKLQEKLLVALVLLGLVTPVWAVQLDKPSGTLINCTSGCQTGCSRDGQTIGVPGTFGGTQTNTDASGSCTAASTTYDWVVADGAIGITFEYINTTANAASVRIEQSIDGGATWFAAQNAIPVSGGFASTGVFGQPAGRFRAAATACGVGCNVIVRYKYVNQR